MSDSPLTKDLLKNRQALMGFIFSLTRNLVAAEEIFQETALAILSEASAGKTANPFMPWAREIARRRVAEYFRKASRQAVTPLAESMAAVVSQAFEENEDANAYNRLRLQHLFDCLRNLPRRAREVVERRYRHRMAIEDIAPAMGWTVPSVNVALSRARKTLAECVSRKIQTGTA